MPTAKQFAQAALKQREFNRYRQLKTHKEFKGTAPAAGWVTHRTTELWVCFQHSSSGQPITGVFVIAGDNPNIQSAAGLLKIDYDLNPNLSPGIRPLYLTTEQKQELAAFLRSLTDPGLESSKR
jgi:hypothetical protein